MSLILVSLFALTLVACGGSGGTKLEFNINPVTTEISSGTANVIVANVEVTKGSASFSAASTIGEAVINNNQVRLSVPYQPEARNITVTVTATVSGEPSGQKTFTVRALPNEEYSQAKATLQGLKDYFSVSAAASEEFQVLNFLLEVSEETESISSEESEQTALWAREYLTDYYLQVSNSVNQDIEALNNASYSIPELPSISQSEVNDVLAYINFLLSQLNLDYSSITDTAINPNHKSRFYMNDAYGEASVNGFEFRDEFGYLRVIPAYVSAKCEDTE